MKINHYPILSSYLAILIVTSINNLNMCAQDSSSALPANKVIYHHRYKQFSFLYLKSRDEGHSPLLFRGFAPQFVNSNRFEREKYLTELVTGSNIGFLNTKKQKVKYRQDDVLALRLFLNCQYLKRVNLINHLSETWIGGLLTNTADMRFYTFLSNNAFAYQFSNVLNVAWNVNRSFSLGEENTLYKWGIAMNVALLAHVLRPNYIGLVPAEVYGSEDINIIALFTNGNKIVLPNKFFRIQTEVFIDRFFLNKLNMNYRLSYYWEIMIDKVSNPYYATYHGISLTKILHKEKIKYLSDKYNEQKKNETGK